MSRFGRMRVVLTDQHAGRQYRCPCGWTGWSTWGHAKRHADKCPQAGPVVDPPNQPGRPA